MNGYEEDASEREKMKVWNTNQLFISQLPRGSPFYFHVNGSLRQSFMREFQLPSLDAVEATYLGEMNRSISVSNLALYFTVENNSLSWYSLATGRAFEISKMLIQNPSREKPYDLEKYQPYLIPDEQSYGQRVFSPFAIETLVLPRQHEVDGSYYRRGGKGHERAGNAFQGILAAWGENLILSTE